MCPRHSICLRFLGALPPDPTGALPLGPAGDFRPPGPSFLPRRKFLATSRKSAFIVSYVCTVTHCQLNDMKSPSDVLMFYCRNGGTCRWKCQKKCWCGRSWCCMPVTLSVMTTAIRTSLASREVRRDERLLCCRQCARTGVRLWLAGRNHRLVCGSEINWRSWLSVSIHTQLHACTRLEL